MEPPVPRSFVLAVLALLGLAGPVGAQAPTSQADRPPIKGGSPADKGPPPAGVSPFAWYYPDRAQRMEVDGKTVMECDVDSEGRWRACVIISETPEGYGFGAAALQVSRYFKMKPKTDPQGKPLPVEGGRITIPLTWTFPR
jgi:protein TonB